MRETCGEVASCLLPNQYGGTLRKPSFHALVENETKQFGIGKELERGLRVQDVRHRTHELLNATY